jgi:2-polyprenyl-6-methoxyphenol hydroxylase-like FAD-dependent oxidoreductase
LASIVVCGGSVLGLTTGILLARDGHSVTVLENDPAAVPSSTSDAWHAWQRKGVAHFRQPHILLPRFRHVLETELPELADELLAEGCVESDLLASLPPTLPDQRRRDDDDRFRFITGRRPVVERVFARAAERQAGLTIRRGIRVTGLSTSAMGAGGVPTVTGVVAGSDQLPADLVIDAMGRRSPALDWLTAAGATRPYLDSSDAGFVYYTRYFSGPDLPPPIGPALAEMGSWSLLTLPGDNGTWSVTVFGSVHDSVFKRVREPGCFLSLVRACPAHTHWLQGEPLTDVLPMGGVLDRYRRFVVDGRPVVTGFAAVGDAWACTNPSAGRGLSVGIVHATLLRDVLRDHGDDPEAFALALDAETERVVGPFYWLQRAVDVERYAEMTALREGREPPVPDAGRRAFAVAMLHDEEVFRAYLETVACLALPEEVLARPGLLDRVNQLKAHVPLQMPAPSREKLVRLLS